MRKEPCLVNISAWWNAFE